MDTANVPEFLTQVLAELAEPLYECLDVAGDLAAGHFESFGMTDAVYGAGQSHLARAHARRLLSARADRFELGQWEVSPPAPNVQVCLNRGPLQLRLLRPDRSQVPAAGTNPTRIAWFSNDHDTLGGVEDSRLIGLWSPGVDGRISVKVVRTVGEVPWHGRHRTDIEIDLPPTAAGVEDLEFRPYDGGDIELPFADEADGDDTATGSGT